MVKASWTFHLGCSILEHGAAGDPRAAGWGFKPEKFTDPEGQLNSCSLAICLSLIPALLVTLIALVKIRIIIVAIVMIVIMTVILVIMVIIVNIVMIRVIIIKLS